MVDKKQKRKAERQARKAREANIERMKKELATMHGGQVGFHENPKMKGTPLMEHFMKSVLAVEKAGTTNHFDKLLEAGIMLPDPDSMDDESLHTKLWDVIHGLASRNTYLSQTDHLSDRELYTQLWTDNLREEITDHAPGSGWNEHIPLCHYEDEQTFLTYYADEYDRDMSDLPPEELPDHIDPPYNRDASLPKPDGPC